MKCSPKYQIHCQQYQINHPEYKMLHPNPRCDIQNTMYTIPNIKMPSWLTKSIRKSSKMSLKIPNGLGAQLSGAQLSAPKKWQIGPRTVGPRGPVVRGPTVRPPKVANWAPDSWAPEMYHPKTQQIIKKLNTSSKMQTEVFPNIRYVAQHDDLCYSYLDFCVDHLVGGCDPI